MAPAEEIGRAPGAWNWAGVLMLVGCAALWSLNGPLIKLLNQHGGVEALTIACYRSLFGGILFLPFALRHVRTLTRSQLPWAVGSVTMFTFMTASFVTATTMTAAANAIVLQYTAPIVVFALSPFLLRERPHLREALVLAVAMVGVGIILLMQPRSDAAGLAVALCSGLGYGALTVVLRGLRRVSPWVVVALNFLGSGLLMLPLVLLLGIYRVSAWQFAVLVVMSVVQFALPYVMFSWALQRVPAYQASLITLLEMVLNPLWTYLAIGEHVPRATLIGGPLILIGVATWILLSWRRSRAASSSA
jgi:drug/metabolite transporter (DMT)-like permease